MDRRQYLELGAVIGATALLGLLACNNEVPPAAGSKTKPAPTPYAPRARAEEYDHIQAPGSPCPPPPTAVKTVRWCPKPVRHATDPLTPPPHLSLPSLDVPRQGER